MSAQNPSIAIVVATLNRADLLRQCLQTCVNQSSPPDKLIVIDGGSVDTTKQVIKSFSSHITYWVSEPDRGIFDALNKGLDVVSGSDYVLVLGSDDGLYADGVIYEARDRIKSNPGKSLYYGKVQMVEPDGHESTTRGVPWVEIRDAHLAGLASGVPHQATFQRADSLLRYGGFDTTFRICGDYDAILRVARYEEPTFWQGFFVARMRRGGISTAAGVDRGLMRERRRLCWKHNLYASCAKHTLALWKDSMKTVFPAIVPSPSLRRG